MVITNTVLNDKLKLDGDGQTSLVICAQQYQNRIIDGELVKPIRLYFRGDEKLLAQQADLQGLLLSQANKKNTLIKHHKTYMLYPKNEQPALTMLVSQD